MSIFKDKVSFFWFCLLHFLGYFLPFQFTRNAFTFNKGYPIPQIGAKPPVENSNLLVVNHLQLRLNRKNCYT